MAPICPRCSKPVFHAEQTVCMGQAYHLRCFKCEMCGRPLNSRSLVERRLQLQLMCQHCYARTVAPKGYGQGNISFPDSPRSGKDLDQSHASPPALPFQSESKTPVQSLVRSHNGNCWGHNSHPVEGSRRQSVSPYGNGNPNSRYQDFIGSPYQGSRQSRLMSGSSEYAEPSGSYGHRNSCYVTARSDSVASPAAYRSSNFARSRGGYDEPPATYAEPQKSACHCDNKARKNVFEDRCVKCGVSMSPAAMLHVNDDIYCQICYASLWEASGSGITRMSYGSMDRQEKLKNDGRVAVPHTDPRKGCTFRRTGERKVPKSVDVPTVETYLYKVVRTTEPGINEDNEINEEEETYSRVMEDERDSESRYRLQPCNYQEETWDEDRMGYGNRHDPKCDCGNDACNSYMDNPRSPPARLIAILPHEENDGYAQDNQRGYLHNSWYDMNKGFRRNDPIPFPPATGATATTRRRHSYPEDRERHVSFPQRNTTSSGYTSHHGSPMSSTSDVSSSQDSDMTDTSVRTSWSGSGTGRRSRSSSRGSSVADQNQNTESPLQIPPAPDDWGSPTFRKRSSAVSAKHIPATALAASSPRTSGSFRDARQENSFPPEPCTSDEDPESLTHTSYKDVVDRSASQDSATFHSAIDINENPQHEHFDENYSHIAALPEGGDFSIW